MNRVKEVSINNIFCIRDSYEFMISRFGNPNIIHLGKLLVAVASLIGSIEAFLNLSCKKHKDMASRKIIYQIGFGFCSLSLEAVNVVF